MKSGYSHQTFAANLAALMREGMSRNAAIYEAASAARRSYFQKHPKGLLPLWLAYPKACRLPTDYKKDGHPIFISRFSDITHASELDPDLKRNPIQPRQASLRQATRLYEGFTGKPPRKLHKIAVPALPETALAIGKVFGIMYSVDATGERFHHEFKSKAQPLLVVSSDGQQVYLIGGSFTFTKRGFVDN